MGFVARIESQRADLVYLVRGKDQGRKAWYYILVDKFKLHLFLKKIEEGSLNLEAFGKILCSGWGKDPPATIVEKIKREYM